VNILMEKKTEQKRENFISTKALVGLHLALGPGLKVVLTLLQDGKPSVLAQSAPC